MIDWTNPAARITPHFTVHEATYLPSWRVYHHPAQPEQRAIEDLAERMEHVRALFQAPIVVHCWMRPARVTAPGTQYHQQDYNAYVGSTATQSGHIYGQAVDFCVSGWAGPAKCAEARMRILPHLVEFGLRMEDNHGGWIHIDTKPVIGSRFFRP